jgi:ribosomal protein S18 acetylase RimI-like enzyme
MVSSLLPEIEILSAVSDDDAVDLGKLLRQLSTTATFNRDRFAAIIDHDATELLVIRVDGHIVGMATLVTIPLPSGLRGHVEDVVVDAAMRGQGLARALLEQMTQLADARGLRSLDLTSRPSRVSALQLYESIGFVRRDTNVLRYTPHGAALKI